MSRTTILYNQQQGYEVLTSLWAWLKPRLSDGKKVTLTVAEEKRSAPQNAHVHPVVRRIAKAAGRPTNEDSLKTLRYLLLEQWRFEAQKRPMFEKSLDGLRWVNVDGGTSDLDKPDCSEFIDWLLAFEAQHA